MKNEFSGKLVALVNLQTELEANMLMDILQQEGISVLTKEAGSGG